MHPRSMKLVSLLPSFILGLLLNSQWSLGQVVDPLVYLDGDQRITLSSTLDLKDQTGFSFRTCAGGQLLYQEAANGDYMDYSLVGEVLALSWAVGGESGSLALGSALNASAWTYAHTSHSLGDVTLELVVSATTQTLHYAALVSSQSQGLFPYLLDADFGGGPLPLAVGDGFKGCMQQGPGVSFTDDLDSITPGVVFGSCPLDSPDDTSCGDGQGEDMDQCLSLPCLHGGACTPLEGGAFSCQCTTRYTGHTCQEDTGPLCPRPEFSLNCTNGVCVEEDSGNWTACDCNAGFTGSLCQVPIDDFCQPDPCQNGANCSNNNFGDGFECDCLPGFAGDQCEVNINECESAPCYHGGACEDAVNSFTCDCGGTGWEGDLCQDDVNECQQGPGGPCLNQGQCFNNNGGYSCDCPTGFTGNDCELESNSCESQPCQNQATCTSYLGGYNCSCLAGYQGVNCEMNIDECESGPCDTQFVCVDKVNEYTCECPPGQTLNTDGNCIDIDECDPNPCLNSVDCINGDNNFTCICNTGYEGDRCEVEINECLSTPCMNGATCLDLIGEYICQCELGFEGEHCQTDIDECELFECFNNATCVDLVNDYNCSCLPGYTDRLCRVNIDDCEAQPCGPNGDCQDLTQDYLCTCHPGFTGIHCETNVDDCTTNPCQNGGECVDGDDDYSCNCTEEWMGKNCTEVFDPCETEPPPCQNNATCTPLGQGYNCSCQPGFSGAQCQDNIDDCQGVVCSNGTICFDLIDEYACNCPVGYQGDQCQEEIDECASQPCLNDATCQDGIGNYMCLCQPIYEGDNCQVEVDFCEDNPCLHDGRCEDSEDTELEEGEFYRCYCAPGYVGNNCEFDYDACMSDPCENGATCRHGSNNWICDCVTGFTGETCSENIDECELNACRNNATCIDGINSYNCSCLSGYTGEYCETEINECAVGPCLNGGSCTDLFDSFTCDCNGTGFVGDICEIPIEECDSSPCMNNATCLDSVLAYNCSCFPGYQGHNCQDDINECLSDPCVHGTCLERSDPAYYSPTNDYYQYFNQSEFSYETAEGFICVCDEGFTGDACLIDIDDCDPDPCQNGGACQDQVAGFQCGCLPGYQGDLCQQEIDECSDAPCQNGATCVDLVDAVQCLCPAGLFGGPYCNVTLTGCQGNEAACLNGGACVPVLLDQEAGAGEADLHNFTCACAPGYVGDRCQTTTQASFAGDNYLLDASSPQDPTHLNYSLDFSTTLPDGVLLYTFNSQDKEKYFLLELYQGNLQLVYSINANDNVEYTSPTTLNDADWHSVTMEVVGGNVTLTVDAEPVLSEPVAEPFTRDDVFTGADLQSLNLNDPSLSQTGWTGCTRDVVSTSDDGVATPIMPQDHDPDLPSDLPQRGDVKTGCSYVDPCVADACNGQGDCVDLWTHYSCDCHPTWTGPYCNYSFVSGTFSPEDTNVSYAEFTVTSSTEDTFNLLEFSFRTREADGLLFYLSTDDELHSIVVELVDTQLWASFQFDSDATNLTTGSALDDGEFHYVRVGRNDQGKGQVSIEVDEGGSLSQAWSPVVTSPVFTQAFLGGQSSSSPSGQRHFKGCLLDARYNRHYMQPFPVDIPDFDVEPSLALANLYNVLEGCVSDDVCGTDPGLCANNGTCATTWNDFECNCTEGFTGKDCTAPSLCSYFQCPDNATCIDIDDGFECVTSATFDGVSTLVVYNNSIGNGTVLDTLSVTLRTREVAGTLLRASDPATGHFVTLELLDASLVFNYSLSRTAATATLRTDFPLNDGEWHRADIQLAPAYTQVAIDSPQYMARANVSNTADLRSVTAPQGALLYLGQGFKGCLEEVRVGGFLLPYFSPQALGNLTGDTRQQFYAAPSDLRTGCHGDPVCDSAPCLSGGTCWDLWNAYACDCAPGFNGTSCQVDLDECLSSPCDFGECVDEAYNYTCQCWPGYQGRHCQEEIDECASDPCVYGTCSDLVADFECNCTANYTGKTCDERIKVFQSCDDLPCQNNATCQNLTEAANATSQLFTCLCLPGFEGVTCDTHFCESQNITCSSNGNCSVAENANYTCDCFVGFTGDECQTDIDECEGVDCNNGNCSHDIGFYNCTCDPGYFGEHCENETDECLGNDQCQNNSTCVDLVDSFECNCTTGYEGYLCQNDTDECLLPQSPCLNGATCNNLVGSFECFCADGFYGDLCQTNPCLPDPCQNEGSTCRSADEAGSDFLCQCGVGWSGETCQTAYCNASVCMNAGNCTLLANQWSCQCPLYYQGDRCQHEGLCASFPCENGAECIQFFNQTSQQFEGPFSCNCSYGYQGANCSQPVDHCAQGDPCNSNGNCTSSLERPELGPTCDCFFPYLGEFCEEEYCNGTNDPCNPQGGQCRQDQAENGTVCDCFPGFEGPYCFVDIDECDSNPCLNSATCVDKVANYTCTCPNQKGYTGQNCDDVNECLDIIPCLNDGNCTNQIGSYVCACTSSYEGTNCELEVSDGGDPSMQKLYIIIGSVVGGTVLILLLIVLAMGVMSVRSQRATRGTYSPSRQEIAGSRVEMGNVLKPPPEERLI